MKKMMNCSSMHAHEEEGQEQDIEMDLQQHGHHHQQHDMVVRMDNTCSSSCDNIIQNPNNYDQEIWFDDGDEHGHDHDVVVVDDDNVDDGHGHGDENGSFLMSSSYGHDDDDHHDPLPNFPCISSSSSSSCSSSTPQNNNNNNNNSKCCKNSSLSTSTSSTSSSLAAITTDLMITNPNDDQEHHQMMMMMMMHGDQHHDDDGDDDDGLHHDNIIMSEEATTTTTTDHHQACLMDQISTQDCMDVMQELGDMDLMDSSTADDDVMWDPSVLFPDDQDLLHLDHHDGTERFEDDHDDDDDDQATRVSSSEEDLAMVFFEWLKSNKESISAEDLRSIKLKRSTIECAARRLGGGKEGMKQLLKLILEWVQNHQLQKKRMAAEHPPRDHHHHHQMMMMNNTTTSTTSLQDSSYNFQSNNLIMSPHDHDHHQAMMSSGNPYFAPPPPPWMVSQQFHDHGLYGDYHHHHNNNNNNNNVFNNGGGLVNNNVSHPFTSAHQDYNQIMMSSSNNNWPHHNQFMSHHHQQYTADYHNPPPPQVYAAAYGNQYAAGAAGAPICNQHQSMFQGHGHDNRLVRLGPSATKEARKKRMARQKRFFSHHHNRSSNGHGNNQNQTTPSPPPTATASMEQQQRHSRLASDANCTSTTSVGHANRGNWMFWSSSSGGALPVMPPDAVPPPTASSVDRGGIGIGTAVGSMQAHHQQYQQQIGLDRRQGCSTTNIKSGSEKNLKFLLQKVLKQSDVGNLGRIVLPKKEAETYLPELEARDGISIAMEDIGTSRTWNMRYRFWPNNKSRMYLLENTGDFVRSNGLQEGDFIVIYSDVKCGKYMIRGVKVRQPGSSKMEARKQGKLQRSTLHGTTSSRTAAAAASPFVKEMVT